MVAGRRAAAALLLAILSLALNGYLLWLLRHPERWVVERLTAWVGPDPTLRTSIRLPAGTPLRLDVPVDERVRIRVDTTIALNTTIGVPLRTPFGNRTVQVPIRAQVPLRAEVPLRLQHTFRLRTRTPDEIAIPLELRLSDLRLGGVPLVPNRSAGDPPR